MLFRSLGLVAISTLVAVGAVAGCNDDDDNGPAGSSTSSSSSGSSSSSTGGASSSSGGTSDAGTNAAFWFISENSGLNKVAASDLNGAESFTEDLDKEKPLDIAIGGGSAWVITDGGKVIRYDVATPKRVIAIDVGKHLSHIVFAAGAVWASDDDDGSGMCDEANGSAKLLRIDPATNAVTTRIPINAVENVGACNRFDGLVTDGKSVFALIDNAFGVARIDPATNTITKRTPLGEGAGYGTGYLAINESTIWVHSNVAKFIIALDVGTVEVRKKTPVPDYIGEFMAATKDAVFLEDKEKTVLRIDNANPEMQEMKTLPEEPNAMTAHGGSLYIVSNPEVAALVIAVDPVAVTEQSRKELPYLFTIGRFVFVE